jgi:hypothetical protein
MMRYIMGLMGLGLEFLKTLLIMQFSQRFFMGIIKSTSLWNNLFIIYSNGTILKSSYWTPQFYLKRIHIEYIIIWSNRFKRK